MIGTPSNLPATPQETPPFEIPFATEEEESGGGFTLLQLWLMLRAHLWLSIGIFVLLLALAFVAIKNLPKSYVAQATLIVNVDNTDPLAGRNYPVGQQGTFFPTQIELIYNSVMLSPVVNRLQLQKDINFTGGYVGDSKTLNDIVLENLRSSLDVRQGPGSQLLFVSAMARQPERAAAIANAVADEYLRQSRQRINAPAIESEKRYSAQLAELKESADAKTAAVTAFRERYGMTDLKDGQGGDSEGVKLRDLEGKLLEAENSHRLLQARVGSAGMEGATVDGAEVLALQGDLGSLQSQLAQAKITFGARHPTVTGLEEQIRAKTAALQSARANSLAVQQGIVNKLKTEASAEQTRLMERRKLEDQGSKLMLEMQLAKDAYAQALRGQPQVQFASEGDYKDVTLVSSAEPPVRASKPNKMKLFLAAFVLSFGLAVGGPFAYELLLDRRIRSRDDLERGFRIVTLAQFGRVSLPRPA